VSPDLFGNGNAKFQFIKEPNSLYNVHLQALWLESVYQPVHLTFSMPSVALIGEV